MPFGWLSYRMEMAGISLLASSRMPGKSLNGRLMFEFDTLSISCMKICEALSEFVSKLESLFLLFKTGELEFTDLESELYIRSFPECLC
jgi:hypothetical protein